MFSQATFPGPIKGHLPLLVRSLPLSPTQRCHSIDIGLACASSNFHFGKTILARLKMC